MRTRNYQQDLKKRLASKEYASVYLETALRESCRDRNWAAFGIALGDVIESGNDREFSFADGNISITLKVSNVSDQK
jgi:hypothetical protein